MSQQYLTLEMIQQERARRARVRQQEREHTKDQLRLLPGGKLKEQEQTRNDDANTGETFA